MVKTLKKFNKFPRSIGESTNEIIVVKFISHTPTVAEVKKKSNALHAENTAKKSLDSISQNRPD